MHHDEFEKKMRALEYFHGVRLLPGVWAVVRVDGHSFSRFTSARFEKPFDERFHDLMVQTTKLLLEQIGGIYAYTESDEISLLLPPSWDLFDREHEKVVSLSAGVASSAFSLACGAPAHFDSQVRPSGAHCRPSCLHKSHRSHTSPLRVLPDRLLPALSFHCSQVLLPPRLPGVRHSGSESCPSRTRPPTLPPIPALHPGSYQAS